MLRKGKNASSCSPNGFAPTDAARIQLSDIHPKTHAPTLTNTFSCFAPFGCILWVEEIIRQTANIALV